MKAKKIMSILLAAAMLVPSLTAYASESETADPFGKYEEGITLTTVRSMNSTVKFDASNPDMASLTENVWYNAYQEQLGITLEYLWTPTDEQYTEKWNAALATGDIPDFAIVDAATFGQLVEADMVADMTDIFEEYASDLYKEYNEIDNRIGYEYQTYDGRLLGLPFVGNSSDICNLMFIRQDWLETVGKEVPTTIEELKDVMRAFQEANLGGEETLGFTACKNFYAGTNSIDAIFESFGGYYNIWVEDGEGGLEYSSTTDEVRNALLELQSMYQEGFIRQDFASIDSTAAAEDVAAGKVGIVFGKYWTTLTTVGESIKNDETADWICVDVPTVDGSPYTTAAQDATPTQFIFVNKDCEHPEAVVKMLNLLYKLSKEDEKKYGTTDDGVEVFKYAVGQGSGKANANVYISRAICKALETGDMSDVEEVQCELVYEDVVAGMEGDRDKYCYTMVFGIGSAYDKVSQLMDEDRIVTSAYKSFDTETMLTKFEDLKTTLDAAMQKVIMGEDISVYDKAVENWYSTGGETMTQETSEWFAANQ